MAEGRTLSYLQRRGFNVTSPQDLHVGYGMGLDDDDDQESEGRFLRVREAKKSNYLEIELRIPLPRKAGELIRNQLWKLMETSYRRLWPATPATLITVVLGVTLVTVKAEPNSWVRSGWLAEILWRIDEFMLSPLKLQNRLSVPFRVAYLAAFAALSGMYLIVSFERFLLRVLLSWTGYLYIIRRGKARPPPLLDRLKLLIWTRLVSILSANWWSSGTYTFQGCLPRMSVPKLEDTVGRYLESMEPVLASDEMSSLRASAENFLKNAVSRKLQARLVWRSWFLNNYVTPWWEKHVYLSSPQSLANQNYYIMDQWNQAPVKDQVFRAANLAHQILEFQRLILEERLAPSMIAHTVPLCMSQYRRLFSTRIPESERDSNLNLKRGTHIVVVRGSRLYVRFCDVQEKYRREELTIHQQVVKATTPVERVESPTETKRNPKELARETKNASSSSFSFSQSSLHSSPSKTSDVNLVLPSDPDRSNANARSDKAMGTKKPIEERILSSAELAHQFRVVVERSNLDAKLEANFGAFYEEASGSEGNTDSGFEITTIDGDVMMLTAAGRRQWSSLRSLISGSNAEAKNAIRLIETASVVVHLLDPQSYLAPTTSGKTDSPVSPSHSSKLERRARTLMYGSAQCGLWFDKSVNLLVFEDGHAGLNVEHSWGDSPVVAHMWEWCLIHELYDIQRGADASHVAGESLRGNPLPMPSRVRFWGSNNVESGGMPDKKEPILPLSTRFRIKSAASDVRSNLRANGRRFHVEVFEISGELRKISERFNLSPDSFVQISLLFAFFLLSNGRFDFMAYESCATHVFREGRTETIRTLTNEAKAFVRLWWESGASELLLSSKGEKQPHSIARHLETAPSTLSKLSVRTKLELKSALSKACEKHQRMAREAMGGSGFDRHLFCLYVCEQQMKGSSGSNSNVSFPIPSAVARREDEEDFSSSTAAIDENATSGSSPPESFLELANVRYGKFVMSSSQQPQKQTGNLRHKLLNEHYLKSVVSSGGGYAPIDDDGFGISYTFVEDSIFFHVTSFEGKSHASSNPPTPTSIRGGTSHTVGKKDGRNDGGEEWGSGDRAFDSISPSSTLVNNEKLKSHQGPVSPATTPTREINTNKNVAFSSLIRFAMSEMTDIMSFNM